MVLTALKWRNNGVNGVEPEKRTELTTLNRKNSGVNSVEPEKTALTAFKGETAVLTAFNRKYCGVNGV